MLMIISYLNIIFIMISNEEMEILNKIILNIEKKESIIQMINMISLNHEKMRKIVFVWTPFLKIENENWKKKLCQFLIL